MGGAGAGRCGGAMAGTEVGGFGGGLLGIMPFIACTGLLMPATALAGERVGIGGGARGFSKLCS